MTIAALYDGKTNENGLIFRELDAESIGSVGEVKTGDQNFLRRNLSPNDPLYLSGGTLQDKFDLQRFRRQFESELGVAIACNKDYYISFSNDRASKAANILFAGRGVEIYSIPVLSPGNPLIQ